MTSPPSEDVGERVFAGRSAAPGLAIGAACLLAGRGAPGDRKAGGPAEELALFEAALGRAGHDLEALIAASDALGADILEFQLSLCGDDDLVDPVRARISAGIPADLAWRERIDAEIAEYRAGDEIMAARAADLCDLRERVLAALGGEVADEAVPDGTILIASDLTPSRFLGLDWSRLAGAVLTNGSATSHVAILARSRGVPMLVDVTPAPDARPGEMAAIDASRGRLILSPSGRTLEALAWEGERERRIAAEAAEAEGRPATTADGRRVAILVNVNAPSDLDGLSPEICDGVGLTRTELLFADGPPDEETQYRAYARILGWAEGRPVTIRTLDAGGDKPVPGVTLDEANPFLGTRGLRLSLRRPEIFRVQLRALARAAALGPLKVMVPMVTLPQEFDAARAALTEAVAELNADGVTHALPVLGMMVEVPAAAMTAGDFDADFYSIGSNDLAQYVLAVARDAPGLSDLTGNGHPAVMELIARTVEAARRRGVEASLCGDLASMPEMAERLIAAGLDTLSVAPASVGRVKLAIAQIGKGVR